jgi:hypothetical protein
MTLTNQLSVCQKYYEPISSFMKPIFKEQRDNNKQITHSLIEEDEHFVECAFDSTLDTIPLFNLDLTYVSPFKQI